MREVVKFIAKDGTEFDNKVACLHYEELVELAEWYEGNELYGRYEGSDVEWTEFIQWISDNTEKVSQIVHICKALGTDNPHLG